MPAPAPHQTLARARQRERITATVALGVAVVGFVAFVARPSFPLPVEDVARWMPDRLPDVPWNRLYVSAAVVHVLRPLLLVALVVTSSGRWVLRRTTGHFSGTAIGTAIAAVSTLVVVDLVTLPVAWWGRVTAEETSVWLAEWVVDHAQDWALVGLLGAGLTFAIRRWPEGWHWRAVLACAALAVVVPLSADLDPFSGPFARLPEGPVREAVEGALERAGIEAVPLRVGSGTAAAEMGAYVSGIGPSTKVVLSAALVEDFAPGHVAYVAMHEYAHREHLDVYRTVLGTAAGLVVAMWILRLVLRSGSVERQVSGARSPEVRRLVIALAVVAVVHAVAGPVSNLGTRRSEAAADWRALELTGDPESAIAIHRFLLEQGAVGPDPPAWYRSWLAGYPSPEERIGLAVRYARLHGVDLPP